MQRLIQWGRFIPLAFSVGAFAVYLYAIGPVGVPPQQTPEPELEVTLPLAAQVAFAAGDRFLAANLSGFRVLVADTYRMKDDDFSVQARLQSDISWLNPAHEDNYYIAAAILLWSKQLDAAQVILQRAADARPFDEMPLFYYGFGRYYFLKDPQGGAQALLAAAPRAREKQNQQTLQTIALRWAEAGYSLEQSVGVLDAMVENAPPGEFRQYLKMRATRLHGLLTLRVAAKIYEQKFHQPLPSLEMLVKSGLLEHLPSDPFGLGYALDHQGIPIMQPEPGSQ